MAHAAGDPGWVAWTNGVDTSIAGRTTPADVDTKIATQHTADDATYVPLTQKGAASGVATLDASGLVPATQIPTLANGAWTAPTLLNSWVNFGSGYQTAAYRKTATGDVELRGIVKLGGTLPVFNLPAGYRPPATDIVSAAAATGTCQVNFATGGDVTVTNYSGGGSNADVCLTGIHFSTLP